MWGSLTSSPCRGIVDTQELQTVALFEKCRQFTKARELQSVGLYPYFNPISESEDTVVVIDGQKRIMLGSNNYLGLANHPRLRVAAQAAWSLYGAADIGASFFPAALSRVMGVSIAPEYGPPRAVNAVPRRLASTEKARRGRAAGPFVSGERLT